MAVNKNKILNPGKSNKNLPRGGVGKSHVQSLEMNEGQPKASAKEPTQDGPENLEGFVDLPRKVPYGRGKSWAEGSGKLGDLDPQEKDQPGWVNTWSPLQEGPNGAGPVRDENYGVKRPRTQSRQEERFSVCNPEFENSAGDGDWTSAKWSPDV